MTDKLNEKRVERELKLFIDRHFVSPNKCKDLKQIQFYIRELSQKIEYLKENFNYVPDLAYNLLTEYNRIQNKTIHFTFQRLYC